MHQPDWEGRQCSCREKAAVTAEAVEGWYCACVCVCVCTRVHATYIHHACGSGSASIHTYIYFRGGEDYLIDSLSSFKKVEAV